MPSLTSCPRSRGIGQPLFVAGGLREDSRPGGSGRRARGGRRREPKGATAQGVGQVEPFVGWRAVKGSELG